VSEVGPTNDVGVGLGDSTLPEAAWLTALATLPGVGPVRLRRLLDRWRPEDAWAAVGELHADVHVAANKPGLAQTWCSSTATIDVGQVWRRYRERHFGVLDRCSPGFPNALLDDPDPPEVLFVDGDPSLIGPLTAAIVGTRKCTRYGVDLARELGALLASSGVNVVSGLALGIDAAAHAGALDAAGAPPIGVAATSLDKPYPHQNRDLWKQVGAKGVLITETPLGTSVERWRFPARNRIIAGLSQVVVVIESHEQGGSLYTAAQAIDRGKLVLAVPGSIRSSASLGCNRLLADGCHPVCDLGDVLEAIGLVAPSVTPPKAIAVDADQAVVLDAVGWQPTTMGEVVTASGLGVERAAVAVEDLRNLGLLASRGPWLERANLVALAAGPNEPTVSPSRPSRPQALA